MNAKILVLGEMPENATPQHYLASGPWCFCNREDLFPDWLNTFTFAPEPLADPAISIKAGKCAQSLALSLIPDIAKYLLERRKTDIGAPLPETYWQILLLPWLLDLCCQIVDRALRCQAMIELWRHEELEVLLSPENCEFNFIDEHDFTLRGSMGLEYNTWLFSRLLENNWPANWHKQISDPCQPDFRTAKKPSFQDFYKSWLRQALLRLPFPKLKGMAIWQALQFSQALGHKCKKADHSFELNREFSENNELADILPHKDSLNSVWKKSLPQSLLNLKHHAPVPSPQPKLKVASIICHENAEYRQKLAMWRACGNRLAHVQHGGNYGVVKFPCVAEMEEYAQDVFFTWGWKTQGNAKGNFAPMPAIQLCHLANAWQGDKSGKLIYVGAEMSAYGRRLDSHPTPLQYARYRNDKKIFFENLTENIIASSLYRPYFSLPGALRDADWLLPQFPKLRICQGPLQPQLLACKLLVIDHHGTTLLEAMAAGIPLIIFWNPDFWPVCQEFSAMLDILANAGIWFKTPQDAAAQVAAIWENPLKWWKHPARVSARQIFCERYANMESNPEKKWIQVLKNL